MPDPRSASPFAAPMAGPLRPPILALTTRLHRHHLLLSLAANALVLGITFGLFFVDRTLPQYVDESDNLLGGQLITRGYRLYVDFFSQHMPFPYFLAALATLLGAHDLLAYRTLFAALITIVFALILVSFRHRLPWLFLATLVLLIGLGHPMFSGEMFLADHLFALSLLVLLLFALAGDLEFSLRQQLAISLCCFVAIQSTLISVYPIALLACSYTLRKLLPTLRTLGSPLRTVASPHPPAASAWDTAAQAVSAWRPDGRFVGMPHTAAASAWRTEARFIAILLAPHLLLLLVLAQQGVLGALLDQAIVFNQRYYARYDLAGDPISILTRSLSEFWALVAQYLRPSAWREVETVLLVTNLAAVGVLWRTRSAPFAAFYLALVVLARMRGPGYHGSPYFVVAFASMALVLTFALDHLIRSLLGRLALDQRLAPGQPAPPRRPPGARSSPHLAGHWAATALLLAYVALTANFVRDIGGFYRRLPRGEGLESPYTAVVSAATQPGDRIWAVPFEPTLYLQTGRLPASTYWYLHPWLAASPDITAAVLRDLQRVQPPVVIFEADKHIPWNFPLPTPAEYAPTVYALIQQNYVALDSQDPLLRDVYLRRDEADALRARISAQLPALH